MLIIVSGDTPERYIAIAYPGRRECAPFYIGPKPNHPLLRIWTGARNFVQIPTEFMVNLFPIVHMKVLT